MGRNNFWDDFLGFTPSLGCILSPNSLLHAFEMGQVSADNNRQSSQPQLDDNFNGLTVEDGDDNDGEYANICISSIEES